MIVSEPATPMQQDPHVSPGFTRAIARDLVTAHKVERLAEALVAIDRGDDRLTLAHLDPHSQDIYRGWAALALRGSDEAQLRAALYVGLDEVLPLGSLDRTKRLAWVTVLLHAFPVMRAALAGQCPHAMTQMQQLAEADRKEGGE